MQVSPIIHVEIAAKDFAVADKFYAEVFGWTIEVDDKFNYHQFKTEGGPGGGFVPADGKNYNVGDIVPYLATDDIDATLQKVNAAGGKTLMPKTEIPGEGWFALFADPTGNRLGLFASQRPR